MGDLKEIYTTNKQETIGESQEQSFVDTIHGCIDNLRKTLDPLDNSNIRSISRDILVTRIINDIRLGNADIMVRLSALDTIFKYRKIFPNPLSDLVHIQYAYEDLLNEITDETIQDQISRNIVILQDELVNSYFDNWNKDSSF